MEIVRVARCFVNQTDRPPGTSLGDGLSGMDIGVEPDPLDPAFGRDQRITVEAATGRGIVRLEIAVLNELRVTVAIPRVIDLLEKDAVHPGIDGHSRGSRADVGLQLSVIDEACSSNCYQENRPAAGLLPGPRSEQREQQPLNRARRQHLVAERAGDSRT